MPAETLINSILSNLGGIMNWLGSFFSSDAVGNLALLLSAIIGVGGSYRLYFRRETRRKDRIRSGIRTELEEMDCLETLKQDLESSDAEPPSERIPAESLPSPNEIPTLVFESNTNEIARLDKEAASQVISFYSDIRVYKDIISKIKADREYNGSNARSDKSNNRVPMDRHKELYEARKDIESNRQDLIRTLSDSESESWSTKLSNIFTLFR